MTDREPSTDEQVVALALENASAFAELVTRYEPKLLRYVRRLGVSQLQDAEDLLQNVFLKVYRNLNGFDRKLSFSSWIYRITHNEVVSFFRKNSARPQGHYIDDAEKVLERMKNGDDTSDLAELNIKKEGLEKALSSINKKYRHIIILRYFEEREYKEISDILKIPIGSVGTLLYRAKKALKKSINKTG